MSKFNEATSTEKLVYLFLILFNFLAIIMIFDFNSFTHEILVADVLLLGLIKLERSIRYITNRKYSVIKKE